MVSLDGSQARAQDDEDIQPDVGTIRVVEDEGRKYRVFLTRSGAIACERHCPETNAWAHLPLREVNESELREILAVRYSSRDEQIARDLEAIRGR